MAGWDDVRRIALGLPETDEKVGGHTAAPSWRVKDKTFAWERPLGRRDLEALGAAAPEGDVLAVRVPDEGAKHALCTEEPAIFFTIPHFDGYPAVLVRLDNIDIGQLEELLVEGWLSRAPKRVADTYLGSRS